MCLRLGSLLLLVLIITDNASAISGVRRFCTTSDTRRVIVKRHEHHLTWKSWWTPLCVNKYK